MSDVAVCVTGALSGEQLLAKAPFPRLDTVERVKAVLGSRASRSVTLFYGGGKVEDDFDADSDDVHFTATVAHPLSTQEREALAQGGLEEFATWPAAAQDDREIIMAAAANTDPCSSCSDPWLQHASPACRDDEAVVVSVVTVQPCSLEHASERLRDGPTAVLAALKQDGDALRYASPGLRDDKLVVSSAVVQDGMALQHASTRLCQDAAVVAIAVIQSASSGRNPAFRFEPTEIAHALSRGYGSPLQYACMTLWNNTDILCAGEQAFVKWYTRTYDGLMPATSGFSDLRLVKRMQDRTWRPDVPWYKRRRFYQYRVTRST